MKPPHRPPNMSDRPPDDEDPDAPPSEEELRAAESLRASLEPGAPNPSTPESELAEAVRSASRPSQLSMDRHKRFSIAPSLRRQRGKSSTWCLAESPAWRPWPLRLRS